MGDPDKILLNEGVDLCQFKGPRCEKSLGATVLENYLEDYFSLWKAVIFFKKRTKCSVSTTVFLLRVAAEAEQKLPQYWTKVRQNKSVITETNSFFFFFIVQSPLFFLPLGKVMLAVSRSVWSLEREGECEQFPSISFTNDALERSNQ